MNNSKISQWINPLYVSAFAENRLHELVSTDPFPHVILDDFFLPEVIAKLTEIAETAHLYPSDATKGLSIGTDIRWGAFADLETIRFVYGSEFRAFLGALFFVRAFVTKTLVPQINCFLPESKGFAIHNDLDEEKDLVMLINLNDNIPNDGGGELCLYQKEKTGFRCTTKSAPLKNRLICFLVSKDSWHGVNNLNGQWARKNIVFDWKIAR